MRLTGWFLDLLYPPKCIFCQKLLKEEQTDVCSACVGDLPLCKQSVKRGECYEICYSAYYYEGRVQESILRYKFMQRSRYAAPYGRILAMLICRERIEYDVLSYVPISKQRQAQRGYSQTKLLAEAVGEELRQPVVKTLDKVRDNAAQTKMKSAAARKENVKNAYRPVRTEQFAGKRVLLIDDVITSGATLSECGRVLKAAGAKSVVCLTIAATRY